MPFQPCLRQALHRATRIRLGEEVSDQSKPLKRCLLLRDVVGFGIGTTIGGGIFVAAGEAAQVAGPGLLCSFLLAAFGCACTGLCYAEMSLRVPSAGSSYSFAYRAVGELAACMVGLSTIVGSVLSAAAVARGWAAYLLLLCQEFGVLNIGNSSNNQSAPNSAVNAISALLVIVLGAVNLCGTRAISAVNGAITGLSVMLLLAFVLFGGYAVDVHRWSPFFPGGLKGVLQGAGSVFFAFLGFDALTCLTEEAEDPLIVPRGIILTLVITTLLYAAVALVLMGLVTAAEVDLAAPLASAARLRGLNGVALVISVGAVGNTMTTVSGSIVGAPRICFAMARDGLLPKFFTRVNSEGTPVAALVAVVAFSTLSACLLDFSSLVDLVSAVALCTFTLVCATLVMLRCPAPSAPVAGGLEKDVSLQPAQFGLPLDDTDDLTLPHGFQQGRGATSEQLEAQVESKAWAGVYPGLRAFAALSFTTCLMLRLVDEEAGVALVLVALMTALSGLGALAAALKVARPFWRYRKPNMAKDIAFQVPFVPMLPLLAMLLNIAMLSDFPIVVLGRMVWVALALVAFYFGFSAKHSRLNDRQHVALKGVESMES